MRTRKFLSIISTRVMCGQALGILVIYQ